MDKNLNSKKIILSLSLLLLLAMILLGYFTLKTQIKDASELGFIVGQESTYKNIYNLAKSCNIINIYNNNNTINLISIECLERNK